jgi:PPM family protein phosphatase
MSWIFGVLSDRGKRRVRNEDAVLALPEHGLFAVADGMGGHAGGDVASRLAVGALEAAWSAPPTGGGTDAAQLDRLLRAGFQAARDAIHAAAVAMPELAEMGTTLTAVALDASGMTALIGHIGDSRLYLLRGGELRQITRDDTWVQAQVDAGELTPRQARRHPRSAMLTRVIGMQENEPPAIAALTTLPGDTLLLCSDGLSGMITDEEIALLLARPDEPAVLATQLVGAANRRGGWDNISVIVLRRTDGSPATRV